MQGSKLVLGWLVRYTPLRCVSSRETQDNCSIRAWTFAGADADERRTRMSSVVKKRRKKMRKHKHRKMLKKTRWQRKHK
jgi:hypothetical protein